MIAILSYHGWETSPEHLADDIGILRKQGWQDISLDHLERLLQTGKSDSGRFFHITSDDGGNGDQGLADALNSLSCPATFFICLDNLDADLKSFYQCLISKGNIQVEDHSFRHNRIFHFRHVIGFHSSQHPLMSSPEKMELKSKSPVCMYGGELIYPRFTPDKSAVETCVAFVKSISQTPGSKDWHKSLAQHLIQSKKGFQRLGKLCIEGSYESKQEFEDRILNSLAEGHARFKEFAGRPPIAFAYPWWKSSRFAEQCLYNLGYRMTFAGQGFCSQRESHEIPRIFVNPNTPRPLQLEKLAVTNSSSLLAKIKETIHPFLYV